MYRNPFGKKTVETVGIPRAHLASTPMNRGVNEKEKHDVLIIAVSPKGISTRNGFRPIVTDLIRTTGRSIKKSGSLVRDEMFVA